MASIIIYTDGSSRGNPGPGGWGAVIVFPSGKVLEIGGREDKTTNNRMELQAALSSLTTAEDRNPEKHPIIVHTDSAYVINGISGWVYGWEKNGWKTSQGEEVLNQDLWKPLAQIAFRLKHEKRLSWEKVTGHAGVALNERADVLATEFADDVRPLLFSGTYESYDRLYNLKGIVASSKSKKGTAYSYVSAVDGVVMTHATWSECKARVDGKKGARYKKATSQADEALIIESFTK